MPTTNDFPNFRTYLRTRLGEHNLTQARCARELGITPTNLWAYLSEEARTRYTPSAVTCDKFAVLFGDPPNFVRRICGRDLLAESDQSRDLTLDQRAAFNAVADALVTLAHAIRRLGSISVG